MSIFRNIRARYRKTDVIFGFSSSKKLYGNWNSLLFLISRFLWSNAPFRTCNTMQSSSDCLCRYKGGETVFTQSKNEVIPTQFLPLKPEMTLVFFFKIYQFLNNWGLKNAFFSSGNLLLKATWFSEGFRRNKIHFQLQRQKINEILVTWVKNDAPSFSA